MWSRTIYIYSQIYFCTTAKPTKKKIILREKLVCLPEQAVGCFPPKFEIVAVGEGLGTTEASRTYLSGEESFIDSSEDRHREVSGPQITNVTRDRRTYTTVNSRTNATLKTFYCVCENVCARVCVCVCVN